MKIRSRVFLISFGLILLFSLTACDPVDMGSKVHSSSENQSSIPSSVPSDASSTVRSNDSVMSTFLDISLFDEENYSEVFLGDKFKFNAVYAGSTFTAPMRIADLAKIGWNLSGEENPNSLVLARGSLELEFENQDGKKISALLFNSAEKSQKRMDCDIVKFHFKNDFYENHKDYTAFQVNGIKNGMAITDIMDVLGTPSHFYRVAADNYYLDYSISEKDRRNGIRIYINPQEDTITSLEIAFYQ